MLVDRKAFMRALKTVTPIIERRNTIPILGAMLVETSGDRVTLTATDLDMTIAASLDCISSPLRFCQAYPATLMPLLKVTGNETISLSKMDAGHHELDGGPDLKVKLGGDLSAEDFPVQVEGREVWSAEVGSDFMDKVKRVSIAISTEETRYYLNGIYFHHVAGWDYRLVATDGHRLVYANVLIPSAPDGKLIAHLGGQGSNGVIIPRKTVAGLMRLHAADPKAPLRLSLTSKEPERNAKTPDAAVFSNRASMIRADIGDVRLVSKLIDGTFPDYSRVIPTSDKHVAEVATADLRRVAGALAAIGGRGYRTVKVEVGTEVLTLSTNNIQTQIEPVMKIAAKTKGGDFVVGFNGSYLFAQSSALRGETARIETEGDSYPTLIYDPTDPDVRTVLMPMRI